MPNIRHYYKQSLKTWLSSGIKCFFLKLQFHFLMIKLFFMSEIRAYAARDKDASLEPFEIQRREILENDIEIDIEYCGVCHSDLHTVRNDWGGTKYPSVPGHEIIGRVMGTGSNIMDFKEGDLVGVGCMVDSCQSCESCKD